MEKSLQENVEMEKLETNTVSDNLKSGSHQNVVAPTFMSNSMKAERSKSLDPTQHVDFERVKRRQPSLMSIGDCNGLAISLNDCKSNKNSKWYSIFDK